MANKTKHLIAAYRLLHRQSEPVVLATVIETAGSTYQKAGARMLIAGNGELNGLLGGGCFERDLVEQARSVFETGQAKSVFYDMRALDGAIWGLGLGCNGAVRILLQLLRHENGFAPLNIIHDTVSADRSGVLASVVDSEHPGFSIGDNHWLASCGSGAGIFPLQIPVRQRVAQRQAGIESHVLEGKSVQIFCDPVIPPWRLLVLGASADAVPVVQCAKALGWRVTVADHRPGHIERERFRQADRLLLTTPDTLSGEAELKRFDALVLMTHNFDYDARYLRPIADSGIPFVGLLGPAHRRDRLLQSLGLDAEKLNGRVFGPVGLDIGAETPEEIALSIMAGIHAALHGRNGGQLNSSGAV